MLSKICRSRAARCVSTMIRWMTRADHCKTSKSPNLKARLVEETEMRGVDHDRQTTTAAGEIGTPEVPLLPGNATFDAAETTIVPHAHLLPEAAGGADRLTTTMADAGAGPGRHTTVAVVRAMLAVMMTTTCHCRGELRGTFQTSRSSCWTI